MGAPQGAASALPLHSILVMEAKRAWLIVGFGFFAVACGGRASNDGTSDEASTRPAPQPCTQDLYCEAGTHADAASCSCVPNAKCDAEAKCAAGSHWDADLCQCAPGCFGDNNHAIACAAGTHWEDAVCSCVADKQCLDNVDCIAGTEWNPKTCKCDPVHACDPLQCAPGSHFDSTACACVQDSAACCDAGQVYHAAGNFCVATCPMGAACPTVAFPAKCAPTNGCCKDGEVYHPDGDYCTIACALGVACAASAYSCASVPH
jgi:hypothetical protein